jgi:hypothetical protein
MAVFRYTAANVGKDVVRQGTLHTFGGSVNYYNHYEKQYGESLKTKNRSTM